MGNNSPNYTKTKILDNYGPIKKLLGLKDGRLAILRVNDIKVFLKNDLESELTIIPENNCYLENLFQLSNEKLITSLNPNGIHNEYKIVIISLEQNNSYNIDQIIPINSKLLKIIELNDSNTIASFELNNEIKIYSKYDLNYINTTIIKENNFCNFKDSIYLGNDKLIISIYSYKIYNLKDMKCIHEINNIQYPIGEIIKLNENKILVSSRNNDICKIHIINILNYEIIYTIILDQKIKNIQNIQKSTNGNILFLMDNGKRGLIRKGFGFPFFYPHLLSEYFIVYKFNSLQLIKIYEFEEYDKNIKYFSEFDNGKIAFNMRDNINNCIKVLQI